MIQPLDLGSIVRFHNKTGIYLGEITDVREEHYVVRVLAVEKHPMQGDLHHPKLVDVPFFHERKALAYREQTNVRKNMTKPYEGEIPDYHESLKAAFQKMKSELLEENSDFARKSLKCLENLERDYYRFS